jgi:hypothetical protein
MTDTTEPGGSDAAPEPTAALDRLPNAGQSITAHRAIAAPATVDRAGRTVEVVWSTGARARNYVPALGLITEELEMSANAVRMDALRSGNAPVLNTHRSMDARDVLGRVAAARLERGRGYATLQFSVAADVEPVWQRIADGTLRSVSVGYRVHRYDPLPDPATGTTRQPPRWAGGVAQLNRSVMKAAAAGFEMNARSAYPENPEGPEGYDPPIITGAGPRITVDPFSSTTSTPTRTTAYRAGTPVPVAAIWGSTAGNRFALSCPNAQIVDLQPSERAELGVDAIALQPDQNNASLFLACF